MSPDDDNNYELDMNATDEQLVAYLDDELDVSERALVEQRLASDEAFRDRLRSLQISWDVLDLLPRSHADDTFTSTTVTLIAAQEEKLASQAVKEVKSEKQKQWLMLLAATALAAAGGFVLMYRSLTTKDQVLVRELPVIEYVDQLNNTPSVEFLEKLRAEGLFLVDNDEQ